MGFHPTIRDLQARGSAQDALHEHAAADAFRQSGRRVFVRGGAEVFNSMADYFEQSAAIPAAAAA